MQRGDDDSYHCTSSFSVAWAGAGTRQKTQLLRQMHQKNALRMQQILNLSDIGNADIQRLQRRHQLVGRVFSWQEKQLLRDEERTADAEPREEQEARAASAAAALLEEESRAAASKQAKQEQRKRKQAQKRTKEQMAIVLPGKLP